MSIWHKVLGIIVLLAGYVMFGGTDACFAAETVTEMQDEILEDLELQEVEKAVEALLEEELSFTDMIKNLMDGGQALDKEDWKQLGKSVIQETIGIQKDICVQILLLILLSALCTNLAHIFSNQQIGEIAFYMCYMMMFVLLLRGVTDFSSEIQSALERIVEFMKVLLPSYYLAVTVSTGNATATIFYQMIMGVILIAEQIMLNLLLPGVRFYFLIDLLNHLTKEELLSRMAELTKNVIDWSLKTLLAGLVGIQVIQRLLSPAIDSLKRTILGKTAGAIPGFGNIFEGVTEIVLGSAVLIKNCLGVAATIVLILLAIVPLLRIGVSAVSYQILSAVLQPIGDKRMVACAYSMGECLMLHMRIILTIEVMFLLTIVLLAGTFG
ncbi:MAG: stage III sporulation protein AE [Ruminococcus sp.]|nr:stage III sporulation protein AE [Ruminococcus sp.]